MQLLDKFCLKNIANTNKAPIMNNQSQRRIAIKLCVIFFITTGSVSSAKDKLDLFNQLPMEANNADLKILLVEKPKITISHQEFSALNVSVITDLTAGDKGKQPNNPPMQLGGVRVRLDNDELILIGFKHEFHKEKSQLHLSVIGLSEKFQRSYAFVTEGILAKIEFYNDRIDVYRESPKGTYALAKSIGLGQKKIKYIDPFAIQDLNRSGTIKINIRS